MKKLLTTVIAFALLFAFSACSSGNFKAYKSTAKETIQTYAEERQDNYGENNWQSVCDLVEEGKAAVDQAGNRKDVDAAVSE